MGCLMRGYNPLEQSSVLINWWNQRPMSAKRLIKVAKSHENFAVKKGSEMNWKSPTRS